MDTPSSSKLEGLDVEVAFPAAVQDAKRDYGRSGPTGTIAEKDFRQKSVHVA